MSEYTINFEVLEIYKTKKYYERYNSIDDYEKELKKILNDVVLKYSTLEVNIRDLNKKNKEIIINLCVPAEYNDILDIKKELGEDKSKWGKRAIKYIGKMARKRIKHINIIIFKEDKK